MAAFKSLIGSNANFSCSSVFEITSFISSGIEAGTKVSTGMSTFEGIKEIGFYLRTKKKLQYCLCLLNKTFQKKKEAG